MTTEERVEELTKAGICQSRAEARRLSAMIPDEDIFLRFLERKRVVYGRRPRRIAGKI